MSELTWHDAAARLILGQTDLAEAATGSRCQEADVIGNLHEAYGHCVESSRHFYHGIVCRQRLKLVGGCFKWQVYKRQDDG